MAILLILLLYTQLEIPSDIKQTVQEIKIINLLNGLEFSESQMIYILNKAKEAENLKNEFYLKMNNQSSEYLLILNQYKERNIAQSSISPELGKNIINMETQFQTLKIQYSATIDRLSTDIEAILDGHQQYQLEQYIPCLIPPPGETRIGQSATPTGIIKQLQRLRDLPDWLYEQKKSIIAEKTLEKLKHHQIKNTEFDEKIERKRILDLFDEIRGLTDIEFALNKQTYAEQLKPANNSKNLKITLSAKIKRFLLDPAIIPIIDKILNISQVWVDNTN